MAPFPETSVLVVSVTANGSGQTTWEFDTEVEGIDPDNPEGLDVVGVGITIISNTEMFTVDMDYDGDVNPGATWEITGPVPSVSFIGGKALNPQSGTVI